MLYEVEYPVEMGNDFHKGQDTGTLAWSCQCDGFLRAISTDGASIHNVGCGCCTSPRNVFSNVSFSRSAAHYCGFPCA